MITSTADYCRQRMVFGSPLLNNQTIHFRLAELSTEVECLRSLIYRSVGTYYIGGTGMEIFMIK